MFDSNSCASRSSIQQSTSNSHPSIARLETLRALRMHAGARADSGIARDQNELELQRAREFATHKSSVYCL